MHPVASRRREFQLIGKDKIDNEIVDTLVLAREKFPGSQISLDALCKRFRIDNSKRKNHTALIDCELLSKVYINLLDQREPMLNFSQNKEIFDPKINEKIKKYSKKVVQPTNEELKLHEKFLREKLKKNYF